MKKHNDAWSAARKHLAQNDPILRKIATAVGPCTLKPNRDHFSVLCKSIYSQQISTVVAAVLFGRFKERFPLKRPTPDHAIKLLNHADPDHLQGLGLSRQKRKYLIDLAEHFINGKIPSRRLSRMSDEEVIESLTAVHGIGRWTAEMFLIFVLNRPDVLPVDDLGLQKAVKSAYRLKHLPKKPELTKIAEPWKPYRSIATWYLWRAADAGDGGW
jgi:DNA-3-methyladenine glycosylase II